METVFVAGVDSIVGANFAAVLGDESHEYTVYTASFGQPVSIAGCMQLGIDAGSPAEIARRVKELSPERIVFCGAGARSLWFETTAPQAADVDLARTWAAAAGQNKAHFTLISSDAVFTGPWMFHAENSVSSCPSDEAKVLRQVEADAQAVSNESLIVRTNAFGWHTSSNWLETTLSQLEAQRSMSVDCVRHASPILATDLAELILSAWNFGLSGIHHIAGAERVNPSQLVQRFADEFHLTIDRLSASESLHNKATGFGCGETSLQTRRIRKALGGGLPLLADGLKRLYQQHLTGFRDRIVPAYVESHVRR